MPFFSKSGNQNKKPLLSNDVNESSTDGIEETIEIKTNHNQLVAIDLQNEENIKEFQRLFDNPITLTLAVTAWISNCEPPHPAAYNAFDLKNEKGEICSHSPLKECPLCRKNNPSFQLSEKLITLRKDVYQILERNAATIGWLAKDIKTLHDNIVAYEKKSKNLIEPEPEPENQYIKVAAEVFNYAVLALIVWQWVNTSYQASCLRYEKMYQQRFEEIRSIPNCNMHYITSDFLKHLQTYTRMLIPLISGVTSLVSFFAPTNYSRTFLKIITAIVNAGISIGFSTLEPSDDDCFWPCKTVLSTVSYDVCKWLTTHQTLEDFQTNLHCETLAPNSIDPILYISILLAAYTGQTLAYSCRTFFSDRKRLKSLESLRETEKDLSAKQDDLFSAVLKTSR